MLHDDFLFVKVVLALSNAGALAAIKIEIVMEGDVVRLALTFQFLQLVSGALPPVVAIGPVW